MSLRSFIPGPHVHSERDPPCHVRYVLPCMQPTGVFTVALFAPYNLWNVRQMHNHGCHFMRTRIQNEQFTFHSGYFTRCDARLKEALAAGGGLNSITCCADVGTAVRTRSNLTQTLLEHRYHIHTCTRKRGKRTTGH